MALLPFFKYHALGNDFILFDALQYRKGEETFEHFLSNEQRIELCKRHIGIGADGVLTIASSKNPEYVAYMHITNADGSIPEMCANGLRCVALWLLEQRCIQENQHYTLLTDAGPKRFFVQGEQVIVEMGLPDFEGVTTQGAFENQTLVLQAPDQQLHHLKATAVSLGNPHLVIETEGKIEWMEHFGAYLERHPLFPNRTNVGFLTRLRANEIHLAVFERGVGLTNACGTGACAAVCVLDRFGQIQRGQPVLVHLPGGDLWVSIGLEQGNIQLRGPAKKVFEGVIKNL